jgi:hypothetical protein
VWRNIGRTAAQLHDGAPKLDLVRGEHRQRCCEGLEHELGHLVSRPLHALSQILNDAREYRHQVDFGLQPRPRHANGLADASLLVDQVVLGDGVQQLVVPAEAHAAGHIVDPGNIAGANLVTGHGHHPVGGASRDVLSGQTTVDRADLHPRHPLRALHGALDSPGGFLDIAHHTPTNAAAALDTQTQNLGPGLTDLASDLPNHCHNLGRPEIQRGYQSLRRGAHAPPQRTIT